MNKRNLLIYLTIILSVESTIALNINTLNKNENASNSDGQYIKSIKFLSNITLDSSWTVISPTTIPLDDLINTYISQGKTKFYIEDGTYDLNNSINITSSNIVIYGQSKEYTKIIQSNLGKNTIEVTGNNVEVSNLTISNVQGATAFTSKNSNNVTLKDCIIYGSPNNSTVAFWGDTSVNDIDAVENSILTSSNIIEGNTIISQPNSIQDALLFKNQINGSVKNNIVTGNRIAFYLCRNSEISSNTIKDSEAAGIRVTVPAYDNKIINNIIDNTLQSGISVVKHNSGATPNNYRASGFEISNNVISNSRYFGIEISNLKGSTINNNNIQNIDFDGIYLLFADSLEVKKNKISDVGVTTGNPSKKLWSWNENLNSGIFIDAFVGDTFIDSNEITNSSNNCVYGVKIPKDSFNIKNHITNNNITGNFSIEIDANTSLPEATEIIYPIQGPVNLNSVVDIDNMTISWDPISNITEYEIERDGIIIGNVTGTNYIDTGLINSTTYNYRIRAIKGVGRGNWSSYISPKTLKAIPPTLIASPDIDHIQLNWNSVAGAAEYEIEQNDKVIGKVANTSLSYLNYGLINNTTYKYRVRAVGGEWSNYITPTTLQAAPPVNLTATCYTDSINLNWDSVTGAAEYEIELNGTVIDKVSSANLNYLSYGLINNTTYKYRVRAVGGNWSNYLSPTTLQADPPGNLTATGYTDNIELSWNSVAGAAKYEIERDGITIDNNVTSTNYLNSGLTKDKTYIYRVKASGGNWSSYITAKTLPDQSNTTTGSSVIINQPSTTTTGSAVVINQPSKTTTGSAVVPNIPSTTTGAAVTPTPGKPTGPSEVKPPTSSNTNTKGSGGKKHNSTDTASGSSGGKIPTPVGTTIGTSGGKIPLPNNIITKVSTNQIIVSWDLVPGATSYEIEIDGKVLNTGNNTSYIDTGLNSNTNYKYRIRVTGGNWSNYITATTLQIPQLPGKVITEYPNLISTDPLPAVNETSQKPSTLPQELEQLINTEKEASKLINSDIIPTNIIGTAEVTSITITWDAISDGAEYEIEADGEVFDNGNNTRYIHTGLTMNTYHSYRVRVKGMEWSKILSITTLTDKNVNENDEIDNNNKDNTINDNSSMLDSIKNMSIYNFFAVVLVIVSVGAISLIRFFRRKY